MKKILFVFATLLYLLSFHEPSGLQAEGNSFGSNDKYKLSYPSSYKTNKNAALKYYSIYAELSSEYIVHSLKKFSKILEPSFQGTDNKPSEDYDLLPADLSVLIAATRCKTCDWGISDFDQYALAPFGSLAPYQNIERHLPLAILAAAKIDRLNGNYESALFKMKLSREAINHFSGHSIVSKLLQIKNLKQWTNELEQWVIQGKSHDLYLSILNISNVAHSFKLKDIGVQHSIEILGNAYFIDDPFLYDISKISDNSLKTMFALEDESYVPPLLLDMPGGPTSRIVGFVLTPEWKTPVAGKYPTLSELLANIDQKIAKKQLLKIFREHPRDLKIIDEMSDLQISAIFFVFKEKETATNLTSLFSYEPYQVSGMSKHNMVSKRSLNGINLFYDLYSNAWSLENKLRCLCVASAVNNHIHISGNRDVKMLGPLLQFLPSSVTTGKKFHVQVSPEGEVEISTDSLIIGETVINGVVVKAGRLEVQKNEK